jgi:hypothetical protein
MHASWMAGVLAVAISMTGCGGNDEPEPEEEPMKVEKTVFRDLVGTQDKARDRANQAVDVHRENLERRLEEDEGAPSEE